MDLYIQVTLNPYFVGKSQMSVDEVVAMAAMSQSDNTMVAM